MKRNVLLLAAGLLTTTPAFSTMPDGGAEQTLTVNNEPVALLLPATTLTQGCYERMFFLCTSLTTAPELPATSLATECYNAMFDSCNSLEKAPVLPATTLAESCYSYMFRGCTSLNEVTCLATDISAEYCTNGWLNFVPVNGTFYKNKDMNSWTTGANGIPKGWTVSNAE